MRIGHLCAAALVLLGVAGSASAQSTNIFLNGIPPSVNSGTKDTGTVRVVLATDQPTLTNPQPVSQSGTFTVQPGNTANTTAWLVTGFGGIFPASQSGVWNIQLQDGSGNAVTSNANGGTRALAAVIYDGSGNPITSFSGGGGGGTEYTEDTAAAANPVGGALIAVRADTLGAVTDANGDNVALRATNNGELFVKQSDLVHIDDNAGSLTVDAPVATPVFVRLSDGSSAIATLPVSLATLPALAAGTANVGLTGRQPTYGAKATITWTGTSLGSASARESTVINWTATRCADARIRIQSKGQASGTNYVDWYVYTALGDTTYTDAASGADAPFTAANRFNSRYLGSLKMNAATSATQGEFQLSDVFGSMPDKWGLIGINNSGAALSATAGDHVLEYECVN